MPVSCVAFGGTNRCIPSTVKRFYAFPANAKGQSLWKCAQIVGVGYGSTAVDLGSFCRDLFVEYYVTNIQNNPKR